LYLFNYLSLNILLTLLCKIDDESLFPMCRCNFKAKKLLTQQEGANKGRYFFTCSNDRNCDFFQWADSVGNNNENIVCSICHKSGHYARYCNKR
jgi:hypothetical protein